MRLYQGENSLLKANSAFHLALQQNDINDKVLTVDNRETVFDFEGFNMGHMDTFTRDKVGFIQGIIETLGFV
ncbi:MAG: hypothetical protein OEZ28_01520 [Nitrospinota bacterium]|nr:hypothetical protein [Nitrospinota bacterium]